MIYIVTAMYAEAHPFITRFQLKKDLSHTHFQVFLNGERSLCLIISGTGSLPAAAAVSSICTEYKAGSPESEDFLLNVGVCGQIGKESVQDKEKTCHTGTLFLCNKISELSTGKTFYPDLLYRHSFAEAQIVTGPRPYVQMAPAKTNFPEEADFDLYDMEAAAVYQAGSYYLGPHQMSFLKTVSDDGNYKDVTPRQVEELIGRNMENIAEYIENLQTILREAPRDEFFQDHALQKKLEMLCLDLHCSRTMSESLRQYVRCCTLSGVDYGSVVEEMYREGKLPCKDKREGKQCFEELKKRLL